MSLSFQYHYLLWLLLLLPIVVCIFFYALHKKKLVFKKLGDADLIKELTQHHSHSAYFIKFLLVFFALAAVLFSIINVRQLRGSEKIKKNGIDILIALDVSKSMLAKDVQPNRLDRAKQLLNKLIDKLSNDRIGITIFAGKAYLQMPLTADHSAAKMYLASASTETIPTQGTVIVDALKISNASFNANDTKYKAVVLISDGEDHDENAVDMATQMASEGVVINTIGIGSTTGAQIIDELTGQPKLDKDGNTIITKLNEDILKQIAQKGNGVYQPYTNSEAVANAIYEALSTLDKKSIQEESANRYKSLFQFLLSFAVLLLFIEVLIREVKSKKRRIKLIVVLLCSGISLHSFAQSENKIVAEGNKAYFSKDYITAIQKYTAATAIKATNPIAHNNLGNALYKAKKNEDALKAYENAVQKSSDPAQKSNSMYNKGVILQNEKKLDDCIKMYKEALKIMPTNIDARHNLQLALQQKQKEQNKKKQDEKQQKKQQNEQQQEQPKQNKSNIKPKDAAKKLEALMQNEKKLQDRLHKSNAATPNKQDKDW